MQVLEPITVTEPMVITSNIPEDDYAQWDAATNYAIGDRVISLQTYQIYQALAPSAPPVPCRAPRPSGWPLMIALIC